MGPRWVLASGAVIAGRVCHAWADVLMERLRWLRILIVSTNPQDLVPVLAVHRAIAVNDLHQLHLELMF
jgi:hypothetical protein